MAPGKRKATPQADDPPTKRAARSRAVKKQDDPVWSTQNPSSHLVNQDLHAKYCDPATYENWTKEDWEEIRDWIPDNAPYNEDGYSIPMRYFKYDSDWRRLVREFQEDLGAGRYEPEWLKQAAKAVEERAAGKFDRFKEDEFEAFWGQKQTLHHEVRAGEAAKIKLTQLVEAGLIKVGDDLSYRRVFRAQTGNPLMIEKDLRVVSIDGTTMTVAIPPGQLRYPRLQAVTKEGPVVNDSIEKEEQQTNGIDQEVAAVAADHGNMAVSREITTGTETTNDNADVSGTESDLQTSVESGPSSKVPPPGNSNSFDDSKTSPILTRSGVDQNTAMSGNADISLNGISNKEETEEVQGKLAGVSHSELVAQKGDHGKDMTEFAPGELQEANLKDETAVTSDVIAPKNGLAMTTNEQTSCIDTETGCILYDVYKPNGLEKRVIEVDGRMDPSDAPIASSWRYIRVLRKNQDLGSLFDIREEYYVWKSPTIVKTPKKGRGNNTEGLDEDPPNKQTKKAKKAVTVLSKERASTSTPPSVRKSGRSRITTEKWNDELGDEDASVSEKDEMSEEEESDGQFLVTSSSKKKMKRREDKQNGDDEEENVHKSKPKSKAFCQHCGSGFSKPGNVKTHIKNACKQVPRA